MTPARARRRRSRLAGLAASAGAHLLLLALLAQVTPGLLPGALDAAPVLKVELAQRSGGPAAARASVAPERAATSAPIQAAPASHVRPTPATVTPRTAPASPTPSPVAAAAPSAAPGGTAAAPAQGHGRWRVHGGGDAEAAARALVRTTVGCDHQGWLHLTAAERERCARPLLEGMRSGMTFDAVPAAKRAYYDQVRAAYAKMHEPAPMIVSASPTDSFGLEPQWRGAQGAHMPGLGCAIKFGAPRGYTSYHDRPAHSLKLGPLPCFLTPPSGLGTEEADVQPPASRREQEDDAAHAAKYAPVPQDGAATPAPQP